MFWWPPPPCRLDLCSVQRCNLWSSQVVCLPVSPLNHNTVSIFPPSSVFFLSRARGTWLANSSQPHEWLNSIVSPSFLSPSFYTHPGQKGRSYHSVARPAPPPLKNYPLTEDSLTVEECVEKERKAGKLRQRGGCCERGSKNHKQ